ncbi:MAG: serine--tRNA ligase [Bacteroidetes bacterium]|jgi:seryl-tRNA synthetase|nr:serine--tRNA ligase [Bacteroidota bacterium]MBX7128631.1 serine--tRNA ligase [Flavobacteriales bacterium]MCC6654459.1 serine--tRNA ligase [Flavobacteriales bacterium]HMU12918.1 serine--tRNA ligase [Flavobacteriales bacterium]HNE79787.1 serine--tRNA ligase [Flavobacteriales bacterium]
MLELTYLRDRRDEAIARLKKRNIDAEGLIGKAVELDGTRRATQNTLDAKKSESNAISETIGALMKSGDKTGAEVARAKTTGLKADIARLQDELNAAEAALHDQLCQIPNAPNDKVPAGKSAEENITVMQEGAIPQLHAGARPHWELAEEYGLFSLDLGVKLTGAGFPVYTGQGARLQRALIAFFLDRATAAGYTEVIPPHMVNADSAFATGQLPDKEGQMYHATVDNLYLIPTAEVPITNLYRDVTVEEGRLPIRNVGYTPCFRREAGSYGAHVRGLNRVHQFDKVEIVRIEKPENSYAALEGMVEHVKGLLRDLELPYRQLLLCGGDMGFASAMTYDMEVYSAAQQRWLEVSSISCFETYQSNRLKLKFKEDKKTRLLHTLNGSALALARIVAALLENNQTPDGIRIPDALRSYTGFDMIRKQP